MIHKAMYNRKQFESAALLKKKKVLVILSVGQKQKQSGRGLDVILTLRHIYTQST
jgi:hypothetical protein